MWQKVHTRATSSLLWNVRRLTKETSGWIQLKKIFYKNATNFTFEKYVTSLRGYLMCWRNMVLYSMSIRW